MGFYEVEKEADWSAFVAHCRTRGLKYPFLAKRLACMVISGVTSADSLDILQPARLSAEMISQMKEELRLLRGALEDSGMKDEQLTYQIHGKPVLDWSRRKNIALETARGLLYLHEQSDPKIIHRDIKATNILLDGDFEAVVGDFGLARLLDHGDSHVTTAVHGTVGHIAPEYLSTGRSSEKNDVFGFGILLLELITGQRALHVGRTSSNKKGVTLDWKPVCCVQLMEGCVSSLQ